MYPFPSPFQLQSGKPVPPRERDVKKRISHNVSHHDGCRGVACAAFVYAAAPFTRQPQLMVPVSTLGLLHAPAEVTSGVPAKVATVPTALSASAASLMIFFF